MAQATAPSPEAPQHIAPTRPGAAGEEAGQEPRAEVDPSLLAEMSPEAALAQLHETGMLERVTVRGLDGRDQTFELPVTISGCFLVDADFRRATFGANATFAGSTFDGFLRLGDAYDGIGKATQPWDVKLGTRFAGTTNFSGCVFRGPVHAAGAHFVGDASFRSAWFKDLAAFPGAEFHAKAWFVKVRCDRTLSMREAAFHGELGDFSASRFRDSVTFMRAVFDERANFWGSSFRGDTTFHLARFGGDTNFVKTRFGGILDLSRAAFSRHVDLHNSEVAGTIIIRQIDAPRVILERRQVAGRVEAERIGAWSSAQADYGQLKQIFEENNDYDAMDWAYLRFRRSRRRARTKRWALGLAERVVLDGGTGYGTRPFNIGLLILAAMTAFAVIYLSFPSELYFSSGALAAVGTAPPLDPFAAVYLSMATLTTIGLGDWIPRPDGWMRFAMTAESLLGFFLMVLFVAMLTRRVVR